MRGEEARKLDQIVSKAMEKSGAPGVSLATIEEGEVTYARGFGARDLERNLPTTPNTLIGIGSCTKSYTCLAAMMLVQEGALTLDTPIRDLLPVDLGFRDSPITVKHLMSHSSGLPSLGMANVLIEKESLGGHTLPLTSAEDFYSFLNGASQHVESRPGESYYYCNAAYTLLGLLVEKLFGATLEEVFRSRIWEPLDMRRTTMLQEQFQSDPDHMTAYYLKEGKPVKSRHPFHPLIYAPGGILSSALESCNYLNMYLGNREPLVDEDLLAQMVMIHTPRPPTDLGIGGYGYGWGITEFCGETMVTHTGSTLVSGANYLFFPHHNKGVVYLTNAGYWGSTVPHAAAALLLGLDPQEAIPYIRRANFYEALAGTYKAYRDTFAVEVAVQGGMLTLTPRTPLGGPTTPLIPATRDPLETEFYIHGGELGPQRVWFQTGEKEYKLYMERWVLRKPLSPTWQA